MPYTGVTAKITVKEGSAEKTIGYISNWSVEEKRDIVEYTQLGVKTKGKLPSTYGWTASADGAADFETASAQKTLRTAMLNGTAVNVKFYLDNTTFLTGSAYVDSLSIDISAEDKANVSISLNGIGELSDTAS